MKIPYNSIRYDMKNYVEYIFLHRMRFIYDYKSKILNKKSNDDNIKKNLEKYERSAQSIARARNNVRRILLTNSDMRRFITLTYAENIRDRDKAYQDFKIFLRKIRRRYKDVTEFKYICVAEKQKRGAIHFHLITNIYIDQQELEKLWKHGFVWIRYIRDYKRIIWYIRKYITKEAMEKSKKAYSCSRNIERPKIKRDIYILDDVEEGKEREILDLFLKREEKKEKLIRRVIVKEILFDEKKLEKNILKTDKNITNIVEKKIFESIENRNKDYIIKLEDDISIKVMNILIDILYPEKTKNTKYQIVEIEV